MPDAPVPESSNALAVRESRELSGSARRARSVRSAPTPPAKRWQPPEGLTPEDARAVVAAAATERDRLLLRVLWATGARVSEALALRPADVHPDSLVLPNLKNPNRPTKRVFLPAGQADLPGALLFWARQQSLPDHAPLFVSRKRGTDGGLRPISRQQAWELVKAASERADVRVLALRASRHGAAGEPAPVHPHLLRHARVRQIVRQTKSLPLAQKQAGWSRLQLAYLTLGDDEARALMRGVAE
jgi:integrase/recombinase XerD